MARDPLGAVNEPGQANAFRCSMAARERDEDFTGTAPTASRWLMLEMPGTWPEHVADHPELLDETGFALKQEVADQEIRLGLMRRRGHPVRTSSGLRRFVQFDTVASGGTVRWGTWTSVSDLLGGGFLGGAAHAFDEPFALVCTHARHDVCCAVRGRPLLEVFEADGRIPVWECSHLGGHRFSANVLLAPAGALYGQVEPDDVPRIVTAALAGDVVPSKLRGIAGYLPAIQAAQSAARLAGHGSASFASLPPVTADVESGRWAVQLAKDEGGSVDVTLVEHTQTLSTPATCGGPEGVMVRTFTTEGLLASG